MCRSTMVLLKSKWLRQPKIDSQKSSLVRVKDLFLDTSGKEISHAKYQPVSEELKDVASTCHFEEQGWPSIPLYF